MTISSLDDFRNANFIDVPFYFSVSTPEAASTLHSYFHGRTGIYPAAPVAPTPGLAGEALTTYAGQMPFYTPSSGNTYLSRVSMSLKDDGSGLSRRFYVQFNDRLWHNSGITSSTTTSQTVDSVTWPARDRNGATTGDDIMVAIEVSTATTNGTAITNTTLNYTNSNGDNNRTATITSFPATARAGTFVPFQLDSGDTGVQSIQSVTLGTSYGTGVVHLVAYRTVTHFFGYSTGMPVNFEADMFDLGMPRMYDNSVPFFVWLATGTTAYASTGHVEYAQG